jgi:hypothetical protein
MTCSPVSPAHEARPQFTPPASCVKSGQLLAEYIRRSEALAVRAKILLLALETESEKDWAFAWQKAERAFINLGDAHFALEQASVLFRIPLAQAAESGISEVDAN